MQHLIDLLHQQECSLVVKAKTGEVTTYNKKGVRDLVWLLDHDAERLRGAVIADKVIGKAAAGLIVQGGVVEAYAEVMSRLALPCLTMHALPIATPNSLITSSFPKATTVVPWSASLPPLEMLRKWNTCFVSISRR